MQLSIPKRADSMSMTEKRRTVLVLLIGEVLEDPRVYRTSISLRDAGALVTVACTNPSSRPVREERDGFSIVRFPHRREFFIKRLYNWLQGKMPSRAAGILVRGHEDVPRSPVKTVVRNAVLGLNFRHFTNANRAINRSMIRAFEHSSFDLVHANDVDTLFAGSELKRLGAARELLYDSHEYWSGIGVHGSAPNDAIRRMESEGIVCADYVVTVNPLIAGKLRSQYGLDRQPAAVMNCPNRYDGTVSAGSVHDPVRVVYIGKLQAFRGLRELVAAFSMIDGGVLTLAGYGPLGENLRRLAEKEGLGDKVSFTGRYRPDSVMNILAEHDIGVMPFKDVTLNLVYTSPNKYFDYAMAGLAVAASDLPFLRASILEHDMGVIFPDVSPGGIAETLNALIDDHDRLVRYRKNARSAALADLCWEEQFLRNYPWRP
ncbi:MAG: glycosyltransferase [Candidatus Latescibacteria bacterium]|nr:glycosyltransferase [Candidatus Latescibacterota bacterium]